MKNISSIVITVMNYNRNTFNISGLLDPLRIIKLLIDKLEWNNFLYFVSNVSVK